MRMWLSAVCLLLAKKRPKKVTRAKYCIKWLLMLYYECGGLNGLWSPFGIETGYWQGLAHIHLGLNGLWSPFGIETS